MLSIYICNDVFSTLVKILHVCYQQSKNTLVLCKDASVSVLDNLLWTYSQTAFLPHCTFRDNFQEDNLIVIGNNHNLKRDNQSVVIFLPDYKIDDIHQSEISGNYEKLIFFLEKDQIKTDNDIQEFTNEAVHFMSLNSLYSNLFKQQRSKGEAFLIINSDGGWKKYVFDKIKKYNH